jgi:hypothetical protein
MWLTSSFRELGSLEVAAVIAFPFVEDVLRICTSVLVTVIDGDTQETIKLAHFTVKEFLIVQEGFEVGLHWYRFTAQLANRCITAQAIESVFGCPPAESQALFSYASRFWPAHARQLDTVPGSTGCDEVQSRINSLLEASNRERLLAWLKKRFPKWLGLSMSINPSLHPVYYASGLGLKRSVEYFWRDYYSRPYQELGFYGSALDAAACFGHVEIVMWLVDRIENPSNSFNFSLVAQYLRVNVPQTLRALLQKGPKPSICAEVLWALTLNPVGEEILEILIEENLASISLTEELICAASHNRGNLEIVGYLLRKYTHEFPVSFRALVTVAGVSYYALQFLVESRIKDIWFEKQDYLDLATGESAHVIRQLVSLGVAYPGTIPITTEVIKSLAGLPSGSEDLKYLLDRHTIEQPLTPLDVLTVARAFELETFDSLLRHRWEDNTLTEALVFAIASNCYLDPPVDSESSPTLKQSDLQSSRKALMSLLGKKDLKIDLTKGMIKLIIEQFDKGVILRLLNKIARFPIFASDVSHDQFSSLLRRHASDLGLSPTILRILDNSYKIISIFPPTVQERFFKFKATTRSKKLRTNTYITKSLKTRRAALLLGLRYLPEPLQGLNYSNSKHTLGYRIRVEPGWRVPRKAHRKHEHRHNRPYDSYPDRRALEKGYEDSWACNSVAEVPQHTLEEATVDSHDRPYDYYPDGRALEKQYEDSWAWISLAAVPQKTLEEATVHSETQRLQSSEAKSNHDSSFDNEDVLECDCCPMNPRKFTSVDDLRSACDTTNFSMITC